MELSYPLVRVPFEGAVKNFRLYQKQLMRELAQVTAQIEALDDGGAQQPGHHMDVEAAIKKLAQLADRLQTLKQSTKDNVVVQQTKLESCTKRVQYLETLQETKSDGDHAVITRQSEENSFKDRLITDYLLGQGYHESAKIMTERKGIDFLVDIDVYREYQVVLADLRTFHTEKAIAWCSQNGPRLRRLESPLEFHLRLQDFIELVRGQQPLEAIQYAQTYLTPLAMQPDNRTLRDAAISKLQIATATLAFKTPEKCGIEAYEAIFAVEQWFNLENMFCKIFNDVNGMHDPPSLCISLYAGLSTLNTRACHQIRDANLKARLLKSESHSKRQRRKSEEAADDADSEERSNESFKVWFKSKATTQVEDDDSGHTGQVASCSRKRKHCRSEAFIPVCPACSEVGSQLCSELPFAYHPHSRLLCRVTQTVIDEHNPPFVLPNGRVYSKRGIEVLKERRSDGMIKCVDTLDVFLPSDVQPVYIL
ncbi:hypothetical protein PsorP6_002047 [Peronosclerospora sorghi]|uniref:Uncharacterized protein n=1 Tax=Peronosclerospora sorghi TaxID=230839 RepID=A0ACC0WTG6_9STRA|nr:hypothetical protein PsorP6_002047 [Peronosclerospora sorghi]